MFVPCKPFKSSLVFVGKARAPESFMIQAPGGQSSNLYLYVVQVFNTSVNYISAAT